MSGLLLAVLIGLLVDFLWLVFNLIWSRASRMKLLNPCKRFWYPLDRRSKLHVTASLVPTQATTKEYRRPATGLGELQAYAYAHESLYAAGLTRSIASVSMSDALPAEAYKGNIITIGGSQLNQVTAFFLEGVELAFQVLNDPPKRVRDLETGYEYQPRLEKHKILTDYGIITHLANPFSPGAVVVVLQGAHTYGTAACGRMLTGEYVSTLVKSVRGVKGPNWQAVIQCTVKGHEVLPSLVCVKPVVTRQVADTVEPNEAGRTRVPPLTG